MHLSLPLHNVNDDGSVDDNDDDDNVNVYRCLPLN